jgi:hypothetical protein
MAKETTFYRSDLVNMMSHEDNYNPSEVGITHPLNDSYIKICNDGTIEIYAGNSTGIFLNPNNQTITFMGDCVKFITNKEDGIRWNNMALNSQASSFTEPALIPVKSENIPSSFRNIMNFIEEQDRA